MTIGTESEARGSDGVRPVFRRILLKISGEALMGPRDHGIDRETIDAIAQEIAEVQSSGVEIALVVGAGNIFRGISAAAEGMDRATADYNGMLATVMNSVVLQDALEIGADAILMAKHAVEGVYDHDPRSDPDAELLPELTHLEAIERGLKVMDTTALSLCMDNHLPIHVFELRNGNIGRVISGERVGTIISTPSDEGGSDGR